MVYSTNPQQMNGWFDGLKESATPAPAGGQDLRIWLERHRGGKVATVVKGFEGADGSLKELGKSLKSLCGGGGTAKDGVIIIQGDHRDKVLDYLTKHGYGAKKAGG